MRTNTRTAGRQAMTGISRASMREMDDDHLMQQCKKGDVSHGETPTDFERFQHLGTSALPLDQDQDEGGGGSGGGARDASGGGGNGGQQQQPQGKSAEAMMLYPNGDRSHPIAVCVDDRRVRPYGVQKGEVAHYSADGSGQMMLHRQEAVYVLTRDGKSYRKDGDNQKRFASLRHVEKDYQERKIQGQQGGSGSGGGSSGSQKTQDHVGKLNTGISCYVDRIEFRKKKTSSARDVELAVQSRHDEIQLQDATRDSDDKDGVVHGYWDSNQQTWGWDAGKDFKINAGQNTQFVASKHLRVGDTMRQGNTYTSGVEHAADHVSGGGAIVNPTGGPDQLDGSGIPGTVSLNDIGARVVVLENAATTSRKLDTAITMDDVGRVVINADVVIDGELVVAGSLDVRGVIRAHDFEKV